MKNIKKYIFALIFLLTASPKLVLAEDITVTDVPPYWGGAGAYASSGSLGNGGSKCSEETTLCFSGSGLYMRLVRYNNGQETTIGTPVLVHTSTFLREEYVVDEEAEKVPLSETEKNDLYNIRSVWDFFRKYKIYEDKSSCHLLYEYRYEFEVVTKYPTNKIQYAFSNQKKIVESGIPSPASGQLPIFIRSTLIPKYLSSKDAVQNTFNHTFTFEEMQNLEEFYIIFDIARRVKGNKIETDVTPTVTSGETGLITKDQSYEYSCGLTGQKVVSKYTPHSLYGVTDQLSTLVYDLDTMNDYGEYQDDARCSKYTWGFESETEEGVSNCTETASFSCEPYSYSANGYLGANKDKSYVSCSANKAYRWKCTKLASTGKSSNYVYTSENNCKNRCDSDGECKRGYVTVSYDKTTYTCKRTDQYGSWVKGSCVKPSVDYVRNLYTKTFTAHSKIVLGRSRPTATIVRGLFTPKDDQAAGSGATITSNTRHDILDKNNKPTGKYEWYIGPTLNTALVGWNGNNKYKMWDASQPASALTTGKINEGYAVGMSIWWLPDLMGGCKEVCKNKTGDELLKCAENFCDNDTGYDDRWDTEKIKKACILACGYEEVFKPNNCKNLSNNSEYLAALETAKSRANNSGLCDTENCRWMEGGSSREFNNRPATSAWCYSEPEGTPEDQRTFVNMACIESSGVKEFTNMAHLIITPGTGIDYKVDLTGNKKCFIWFDLESWKLAYASYHSRESVCLLMNNDTGACTSETASRKLLEKSLENYNNASSRGYKGEVSNSITSQIDSSEKGDLLQWAQTNYSVSDANGSNRTTVSAEMTEYLYGDKIANSKLDLPKDYDEIVTGIVEEKNVASANMYNRLVTVGTVHANGYTTISNALEEFGFEKYCVSTDGTAVVYEANADGTCGTISVKGKNEPVSGETKAYTSLLAANSGDYSVDISATVTTKPSLTDIEYDPDKSYVLNETRCTELLCPDKKQSLSCDIIITENEGTVVIDGVYNGQNGVKAKISYSGTLEDGDSIESYAILKDASTAEIQNVTGKIDSINITPIYGGLEEFNVYCVVKTKNGKTGYNQDKVKLANCNNTSCTITEDSGGSTTNITYTINVTNSGGRVYMATSDAPENKLLLVNNGGQYKFNLQRASSNRLIILYGIIDYGNSAVCCQKEIGDDTKPRYNCEEWNKDYKKSYLEVTEYCKEHLHEEVHNHVSVDSCVQSCIAPCPNITKCDEAARNTVQLYCNGLYGNNSTKSNQCMNRCYAQKLCNDDKVLYRPINNYNPFPNSYDSDAPYQSGKREVGANWVGFTEYIKFDDKDSTSVTGPSRMVEYVIDLTPEDIRNIRDDTERKKKDNNEPYSKVTYSTQLTKEYNGEYISSFIHDDNRSEGGFASIFTDPSEYKK